MSEIREPTPREFEIRQRAQTTAFPDIYYGACHKDFNPTIDLPPIEEWEKALVGKKLLKIKQAAGENVRTWVLYLTQCNIYRIFEIDNQTIRSSTTIPYRRQLV